MRTRSTLLIRFGFTLAASPSDRVLIGRIDVIPDRVENLELRTSGVDVMEELMAGRGLVTEAEGEAEAPEITCAPDVPTWIGALSVRETRAEERYVSYFYRPRVAAGRRPHWNDPEWDSAPMLVDYFNLGGWFVEGGHYVLIKVRGVWSTRCIL